MQDEFLISKEELSKLIPEYTNPDSKVMQEIYEMCLQDKVKAHSHEEIALLLFLVLKFKWEQIFKRSANLELCLKDFKEKQDVYDLYRLFRRTKFEIGLTIIFENDPIPEEGKVDFLVLYSTFLILFFRHIKCIDLCNEGLARDKKNSTFNFYKASLLDLCYIVKHTFDYRNSIEIYRQDLLKCVSLDNICFDKTVSEIILNGFNVHAEIDHIQKQLFGLHNVNDSFLDTDLGKKYWSKEKDYYLKKVLFLNPLNNFGMFIQASLEELNPLDIGEKNQSMFDSIIEDYKFCRRKTYEYSVLQNITIREMCSVYSFAYSIYDKIAYLFRAVYDIDVPEDKVDFTEKNLFSRPYKNSNQKFYEIKNPAIIPLYLESQEVRAKNKPKGIGIGTAELNEFRNFIEHKSTLLIDADKLKSKSEQLIRNIRDLIIESYLLLQGSKENMTGDLTVCAGTAFAKGLQIHNQLNKKS